MTSFKLGRVGLAAAVLLLMASCEEPPAPPSIDGYRVGQSAEARFVGTGGRTIQILEDHRITPENRAQAIITSGTGACRPSGQPEPGFCTLVANNPLRPALLRVVGDDGAEIARMTLAAPAADLIVFSVAGRRDTVIAVAEDVTEYGAPAKAIVRFPRLRAKRFAWATMDNAPIGTSGEVVLTTTLRDAWRVDSTAVDPTFLAVGCAPDFHRPPQRTGDATLVVTYARVYRHGEDWRRDDRAIEGCWESREPFPARTLFPSK